MTTAAMGTGGGGGGSHHTTWQQGRPDHGGMHWQMGHASNHAPWDGSGSLPPLRVSSGPEFHELVGSPLVTTGEESLSANMLAHGVGNLHLDNRGGGMGRNAEMQQATSDSLMHVFGHEEDEEADRTGGGSGAHSLDALGSADALSELFREGSVLHGLGGQLWGSGVGSSDFGVGSREQPEGAADGQQDPHMAALVGDALE